MYQAYRTLLQIVAAFVHAEVWKTFAQVSSVLKWYMSLPDIRNPMANHGPAPENLETEFCNFGGEDTVTNNCITTASTFNLDSAL
jgi:hypothetical protein